MADHTYTRTFTWRTVKPKGAQPYQACDEVLICEWCGTRSSWPLASQPCPGYRWSESTVQRKRRRERQRANRERNRARSAAWREQKRAELDAVAAKHAGAGS